MKMSNVTKKVATIAGVVVFAVICAVGVTFVSAQKNKAGGSALSFRSIVAMAENEDPDPNPFFEPVCNLKWCWGNISCPYCKTQSGSTGGCYTRQWSIGLDAYWVCEYGDSSSCSSGYMFLSTGKFSNEDYDACP